MLSRSIISKLDKSYVKIGGFLRTPARQAAQDLFKLKPRPTAIFAASDVMAMEVMDVAKSNKISIPSDLAICGFDDNPLRLTSVDTFGHGVPALD